MAYRLERGDACIKGGRRHGLVNEGEAREDKAFTPAFSSKKEQTGRPALQLGEMCRRFFAVFLGNNKQSITNQKL